MTRQGGPRVGGHVAQWQCVRIQMCIGEGQAFKYIRLSYLAA